jgi:hypothetical protein
MLRSIGIEVREGIPVRWTTASRSPLPAWGWTDVPNQLMNALCSAYIPLRLIDMFGVRIRAETS